MKQGHLVVVGGGHAGVEAATASARMGMPTTLVTLSRDNIGVMSCNPAMGGLGKGHLIREIDALGGVMGIASDAAGIQYRLLNRRKGPAVQGPRAQIDRALYRAAVQGIVNDTAGLTVVEGQVTDLIVDEQRVAGVSLGDGTEIRADAVILTTGTFLRGVLHIGDETRSGGRVGEAASIALADRLYAMDLPMGRLKTGTPPRIDGSSIDWSVLELQPGDEDPVMLSLLSEAPSAKQVSCGITHTNRETHEIIGRNLHRSALYGGGISGKGPRYCPSIEDKISRFRDKESHQIFLEPEGLDDTTVYPNGISTSLPLAVQQAYVHSIRGMEAAVIRQPGYAIEYDFVDPRSLGPDLQLMTLSGLYLAGQVNGTTGYEEAGAQGLYAAMSAVSALRGDAPITLSRAESYISVMVDDLVTRGVTEPYRMFTSRAEHRLSLRADNADQRLTPLGIRLGLVSDQRALVFQRKLSELAAARVYLSSVSIGSSRAAAMGLPVSDDGKVRSALDLLSISNVTLDKLIPALDVTQLPSAAVSAQLERDAAYAHYIARQEADISRLRREETMIIPADMDFDAVPGLSSEVRDKLRISRPASIASAGRLEGVTPAALNAILLFLRKSKLHRSA